MTQITIHRLKTRLHAPPQGVGAVGARLKRLVAEMAERALEPALRSLGLDDAGELCIRRVVVPPLRLDLGLSDTRLVEGWADAWAAAIAREAANGGPEVLRYGSRTHALADLLAATSVGDLGRAWAWRQLGLWPADGAVTPGDANGLAQRALLAEPQAAIGALAHLASQPASFAAWLRRANPAFLRALAEAVWRGSGAPPVDWSALEDAASSGGSMPASEARGRLLARSAIARASSSVLAAPSGGANPSSQEARARTTCTALVVLALAEAEPALLRAPVGRLAPWLAALAPHRSWMRPGEAPADRFERDGDRIDRQTQAVAKAASAVQADVAEASATALPDLRRRGRTDHAGLLFLLNLATDLGWPEALLGDVAIAAREPRWCLHQLAMRLLPLEADDPAALAFAGLVPDASPPDTDASPPDADERRALQALADAATRALRARLRARGADPEPANTALLARVCRRRGEIVADPGWLEVHLAMEDVDIDLRASGLDLDPGWVPWLGAVVRFVYE